MDGRGTAAGETVVFSELPTDEVARFAEALRAARRDLAEAAALRNERALALAGVKRERRLAAGALAEVKVAVDTVEAACAARESGNRGIRRTLEKLCARLDCGKETTWVDPSKPLAVQVEEHNDALEVEERTLLESIVSIREVGDTLRKRVALEREKRHRLKASCRAKLGRLEETKASLTGTVERKQKEVEALKGQVANQNKLTQAAVAEVRKERENLAATIARDQQQHDEKRALQLEVLRLEQEHERMRQELATTLESIDSRLRRRDEARRHWNLNHLAKVDARAVRCRSLDQNILVT